MNRIVEPRIAAVAPLEECDSAAGKKVDLTAARGSCPRKRTGRLRLRTAVDRYRIVRFGSPKPIAHLFVARVHKRARIDQPCLAKRREFNRKRIGVSVTAIENRKSVV